MVRRSVFKPQGQIFKAVLYYYRMEFNVESIWTLFRPPVLLIDTLLNLDTNNFQLTRSFTREDVKNYSRLADRLVGKGGGVSRNRPSFPMIKARDTFLNVE